MGQHMRPSFLSTQIIWLDLHCTIEEVQVNLLPFYASATKHLGIGMSDGWSVSTQLSKKFTPTRDVARRFMT